ncbi:Nucleolar complex protein 4, putative isoform 2 [Hibiscus syriacus]|uniref:Nucleolar complex protein 4, putative isoform 2 n=1 Tax=Hibiscus syriacus TaxID=106335 RepID=A0A6A3A5W9_HIBSY|nr:protein NUCLEOLAR COMPLEX ASSOCIATED 4-like [Hibiscus syriacus]KAE8698519.1 Nucleolar complex protein 4, putative isoform 2 [Hibiscus syriacus]
MASILTKKPKKTKLKELKTLGQQLLSSRAHINNLPILLTFISPSSPPQHVLESLLSLQSFFTTVLPDLPPSHSSKKRPRLDDSAKEGPEFIYRTWLRSKFDEFITLLIEVLVSPDTEDALREIVLDSFMEFVKLGNGGSFYSAIYHKLLRIIVQSATPVDFLSELLASKYFKYIDVRYFTFISMEKLSKTLDTTDVPDDKTVGGDGDSGSQSRESIELSIHKIHYIISHIPPLEGNDGKSEYEMWSGSGFSSKEEHDKKEPSKRQKAEDKKLKTEKQTNNVLSPATIAKKMKLKFTKAWISFLRLPIPIDVYKEVLGTLHQAVIPHLSNPIILCDFLTRSYDIGGVVSVMALSSLFILMTQHGLEYPNFYEKLYALLSPSIFMAKHRAKFFQLLDSCLKSPLLPAYLAAAFAKKLSRLSISVPPSGALVIIALIHNLLRRHPSINCLVHKEDGDESSEDRSKAEDIANKANDSGPDKRPGIDHFNSEESNPLKSNAMRSSLWEIDSLRHHYCPPVSRFVLSLENDLTVRSKTTEMDIKDFSSGSYATIFGDEIRRRVKQVPLAFYKATPTSLFPESEFCGWTFKHEGSKENESEDKKQETSKENVASTKRQRLEC